MIKCERTKINVRTTFSCLHYCIKELTGYFVLTLERLTSANVLQSHFLFTYAVLGPKQGAVQSSVPAASNWWSVWHCQEWPVFSSCCYSWAAEYCCRKQPGGRSMLWWRPGWQITNVSGRTVAWTEIFQDRFLCITFWHSTFIIHIAHLLFIR